MRSSPKENQSLEVKVKGISEMEFSLSIPLLSLSETAIPQHLMKWLFQRFDLKIDFLIDLVGWVERSESQQPRKQD